MRFKHTHKFTSYVGRPFAKRLLLQHNHVRKAAEMVLRGDSGIENFMCEEYFHWGMSSIFILIILSITNDSIRKDFKSRKDNED